MNRKSFFPQNFYNFPYRKRFSSQKKITFFVCLQLNVDYAVKNFSPKSLLPPWLPQNFFSPENVQLFWIRKSFFYKKKSFQRTAKVYSRKIRKFCDLAEPEKLSSSKVLYIANWNKTYVIPLDWAWIFLFANTLGNLEDAVLTKPLKLKKKTKRKWGFLRWENHLQLLKLFVHII